MKEEAERLVKHHSNARALVLDIGNKEEVARLIEESDLVIRSVVISTGRSHT